ncbi:MAG: Rrf2 family transcriptional regulator [Elusimicrobia bacterium]|nr:Rrf2 family transcriptional regulator [Elusimicrobiota bacterium]
MAANSRLAVAAHIVSVLASHRDESVPSRTIAASVNTNPTFIRRILAALTRAGIVESAEGKTGGSRLTRCPTEISLWDLASALGEERLFAVHKNPVNPKCPVSRRMKDALGRAFSDAERAAEAKLRKVSVQELLGAGR